MARYDDLHWDLPYPSRRDPVIAKNVVATSQPLATQAGIETLRQGGNAIDAALAAAITLTVVEPCSNGVGSDAFALLWDGNQLVGLNASGRSPSRWDREHFRPHSTMPRAGWDSVTVPGAVSAWVALSERFGKLSFRDLFKPAIEYAKQGFHVGRRTAYHWSRAAVQLKEFEGFCEHFLIDGRAPRVGELFRRPDFASTLASIAESKGASFYHGALLDRILQQSKTEGGLFERTDFEQHSPTWCDPIAQSYGDVTANEIPPNGQGLAALIALGILERISTRDFEPLSPDWTHRQLEAMKIAVRTSFEYFADPAYMKVTPAQLLSNSVLDGLADQIVDDRAAIIPNVPSFGSDTVYLTTADASGKMVSFIQSNYQGFGSGVVIKGTGIALQNRGAGFTLEPNHANEVGPNKRPFHTIIPGFVSGSGIPELAFGVMGGHMQHQGHVQMIARIFDHKENPQAASDAPRWYVAPNFEIFLEQGFPEATVLELRRRGHTVQSSKDSDLFGGAQLILRLDDGYCGASDHRKEGSAAGF